MEHPFAITLDVGTQPRQPYRLLAHDRGRSMSTACRHAITPARRARTFRAGCTTPKPATTRAHGACSRKTIRCRRSWGASAITPAKPPAIAAQLDEAVGINSVERFLGDEAIKQGWRFAPPADETRQARAGRRRGPSGLSAAYHLRRLGHEVDDPRSRADSPAA